MSKSPKTVAKTTETPSISVNDLWVIVADATTEEPKYLVTPSGWNPDVNQALLFRSKELAEQFHNLHMHNRREEGDLIMPLGQVK